MSLVQTLRESRELEYLLIGDLSEILQSNALPRKGKAILVLLDTLLESMPQQLATPSDGQSLIDDLDQFTSPASELTEEDRLEDEYRTLYSGLRTLRRRLSANAVNTDLTEWLTHDIAAWTQAYRGQVSGG